MIITRIPNFDVLIAKSKTQTIRLKKELEIYNKRILEFIENDLLEGVIECIILGANDYKKMLEFAIIKNKVEIAKYLLTVPGVMRCDKYIAFIYSTLMGNVDILKILVDSGMDVKIFNDNSYIIDNLAFDIGSSKRDIIHLNSENHVDINVPQNSKLDAFGFLIESGGRINSPERFNQAIIILSKIKTNKSFSLIKLLLNTHLDVHKIDDNTISKVISNGDLNVIKYLMKKGIEFPLPNFYVNEVAKATDGAAIVKYLLKKTDKDYFKDKYVEAAVKYGNVELLEYLLTINKIDLDKFKDTMIKKNQSKIIKILIAASDDQKSINILLSKNCKFMTSIEDIKYLEGIDFDINSHFEIILMNCLEKGNVEVIQYLVKLKPDYDFNTELFLVRVAETDDLDIIKLAVKLINTADVYNEILRCIYPYQNKKIIKYLVSMGADINVDEGYLLRAAAENGDLDMLKYLVKLGGDINISNGIIAKLNHELSFIKYFEKNGINHHINNDTLISLMYENDYEGINYLIKKGCNINSHKHPKNFVLNHACKYADLFVKYVNVKSFVACDILKLLFHGNINTVKYIVIERVKKLKNENNFILCAKIEIIESAMRSLTKDSDRIKYVQLFDILMNKPKIQAALNSLGEFIIKKYGIYFDKSGIPFIQKEYDDRQILKAKLKKEIIEVSNRFLMRPGSMRMNIVASEFGNVEKSEAYRYMN